MNCIYSGIDCIFKPSAYLINKTLAVRYKKRVVAFSATPLQNLTIVDNKELYCQHPLLATSLLPLYWCFQL